MKHRPLNPDDPYYTWGEYEGRLNVLSECCGDSFSESEEIALRDYLLAKHPIQKEQA